MKRSKKNIIISFCLLLIAIIYTILVKKVDLADIGPNESVIGFSTINSYVADLVGVNMSLYNISEILGYIAILIAFIYALIGFIQLIKRKNIFKIDREILLLGGFYVVVIGLYLFFEKFIINYRPILIDNVLEASYPSSHTILSLCVCISSILVNNRLFKNNKNIKIVNILSILLAISILLCRFLSGAHWFTDIIGGILFSVALLFMFKTVLNYEDSKVD